MSRSVGNDCVLAEHVNFWLCTNPLMRLLWVWCEGSFQGSREEDDIIWSRRVKSLSLGMPRWFIPAYFKKTQASKLGDAQGIPFFIDNIIRFLPWNYIFIPSHLMCFFLERRFVFVFCFVWIKWILAFTLWERDTLRCSIWTSMSLVSTHSIHGEVSSSLNCYMVGIGKWYM